MSDELAKLESALRATSPRAPAVVRERAISEAMAAFDRHRQGMSGEKRHRRRVPKSGPWWIRKLAMPLSRPSLAFAGSAALVVVAVVVSHQVVVTPHVPSSEVAGDAGENGARTFQKGLLLPSQVAKVERPPAPAADETPESPPPPATASAPSASGQGYAAATARLAAERLAAERARAQTTREASTPKSLDAPIGTSARTLGWIPRPDTYESRRRHAAAQSHDRFTEIPPNPVKVVAEEPVSTFSIDVDTASYSFMRTALNEGFLPEKDAVRTEELVNYFPYDHARPETPDPPFAAHVSVMPAPWNDAARLMHIGIEGYVPDRSAAPPANLVFLVDTSGSMNEPNKLPLLVRSLKLLLNALAPEDRVAIVAYAGAAGVVLSPTRAAERGTILASLERLHAAGSTAGAEGIRAAYRLAGAHFVEGGVNRVILATDGDFNVGITDPDTLENYVARKRSSGISLSVLGFGMGNYNDELMQRLAQSGNGNAAYIDSLSEARKVLLEEAASTLVTIAKDVKIQVEFNPAMVGEYRLIGYETRLLAREDFRNDKVDAGEIGAGHTVTAIYEFIPAGSDATRVPSLRYQAGEATPRTEFDGEIAFLKLRYKLPDAETSTLTTRAVTVADAFPSVDTAPRDVRFAAAVAAFGQLLRGGRHIGDYGHGDIVAPCAGCARRRSVRLPERVHPARASGPVDCRLGKLEAISKLPKKRTPVPCEFRQLAILR